MEVIEQEEFEYTDNKQLFLEQFVTKVVEEGIYDSQIKDILEIDFLGNNFYYLLKYIIETLKGKDGKVTKEFLSENYSYVDRKTSKTQHEIMIQLKELYYQYKHNLLLQQYSDDRKAGKSDAFNRHVEKLSQLKNNMQQIKVLNTHDTSHMVDILKGIANQEDVMYCGNPIFDGLEPEKGQLIGILGSTGDGKSVIIQSWHSYCAKRGYKIAHFTMELSEKLFTKRLISALGICPFHKANTLTEAQQQTIANKFLQYKPMDVVTLGHGRVTLAKVEKILQYNISNNTPVDVLFIDYIQLLKEDFNPMTSQVAKSLKELAQLYNVLIVMGIQTNNEGRLTEEAKKRKEKDGIDANTPPDIDHIKFVKGIADDCDIVVALRGISLADRPNLRRFKIVTRKHRNGIRINSEVEINLNYGKWRIIFNEILKPQAESSYSDALDEDLDEEYSEVKETLPQLFKGIVEKRELEESIELQGIF